MEYLAVVDQFFAAQDHSDNLNIFTGPLHRLLERYTMPVFNHIGSRWAKAEENPAFGTFIQRGNSTGDQCWSSGINISDASPNLDTFGGAHKISHGSKEFVAPGFA